MDIFVGNDNILELSELKNAASGAYLNAATVEATITDWATGTAIPSVTNPVTLSFVSGSNGRYRAVLESTAGFTPGQKVRIVITSAEGTVNGRWEFAATARRRGAGD